MYQIRKMVGENILGTTLFVYMSTSVLKIGRAFKKIFFPQMSQIGPNKAMLSVYNVFFPLKTWVKSFNQLWFKYG